MQRLNENVKTLENSEYHNGHHKRHSSADVSRDIHGSSSKSSLPSNYLSHRSCSLNSLASSNGTETVDSQMVDQEDIVNLTAHVRHFSDALGKLRNVLPGNGSDTESDGKTVLSYISAFILPLNKNRLNYTLCCDRDCLC